MENLLLLIGAVLLCLVIRIVPRLFRPNYRESDIYGHLGYAKAISENGYKVPSTLSRIVIPNRYTYPYFYHYLMALFGTGNFLRYEKKLAAVYDSLNCVFLILMGKLFFAEGIVVLSAFLFAIYPALLKINDGPRSYTAGPRLFVQLMYNIHLYLFILFELHHNKLTLLLAMVLAAVVLLSSKFGSQVILLCGLFISVFLPAYFLVMVGGMVVAVVISRGKYIEIIKGHIRHSLYLKRHVKSESAGDTEGTSAYMRKLLKFIPKIFSSPVQFLNFFFHEKYWLHILLSTFFVFIVLFKTSYLSDFTILYLFAASGMLMFLLTKVKYFLFLGKAERYLEFTIIPAILLFTATTKNYPLAMTLLVTYSIFSSLYFIRLFIKSSKVVNDTALQIEEGFRRFADIVKPDDVVWGIASLGHTSFFFLPGKVLTVLVGNLDEKLFPGEEFELLSGNFPLPSLRFKEALKKYDVSYLVIDDIKQQNYIRKLGDNAKFFSYLKHLYTAADVHFYEVIRKS